MLNFIDRANLVTLSGAVLAFSAILLALEHHPHAAFACLVAAGLCDFSDGFLARQLRRTEIQKQFGQNLDSLSDACSFVFTPSIILYSTGNPGAPGIIILALYICAGIWRLAYFNVTGLISAGENQYYHGLPVTYAAVIFPAVALIPYLVSTDGFSLLLLSAALISVLMVSSINIPKPQGRSVTWILLVALILMSAHTALEIRQWVD